MTNSKFGRPSHSPGAAVSSSKSPIEKMRSTKEAATVDSSSTKYTKKSSASTYLDDKYASKIIKKLLDEVCDEEVKSSKHPKAVRFYAAVLFLHFASLHALLYYYAYHNNHRYPPTTAYCPPFCVYQ